MTDAKTTAKVSPRKGESDTGKLDIGALAKSWRWAKDNPIVLAAVALLGGGGGEQVLAQIGQNAHWWQIALGIVGLGVLNWMATVSKTLVKIQARLERGSERMDNLEDDVASLHDWRKGEVEARAHSARKPRARGSEGNLRTA